MEYTAEQLAERARYGAEYDQKMAAHHRVVNAQPRLQQDRVSRESMARIAAWADGRANAILATLTPEQLAQERAEVDAGLDARIAAEAQASDTPAAEASAPVVKPGAKPAA